MSGRLSLQAVTTGYSRAPILREVTLEVGNEFVGLLGANCAGKSTILRAVCGELRTWSGTISFDDKPLGKASTWARTAAGIAHVPEGRHVFKAMTVRENLDVAGLVSKNRRELLDQVFTLFPRLSERQGQSAGSLSGGEQQMLAIGRALMTDPRVLLVDEMTAGLAPVVAQRLVESLVEIRERGIGILVVEQSPHLIAEVVDRVYLLEQGRVVQEGKLADLGGADALAELYLGVGEQGVA